MSNKSDKLDQFFAAHNWSDNTIDRYRRELLLFLEEVEDPVQLDAAAFRQWLESHEWGNSAQWIASNAVKAWIRWNYGENHPALTLKLRREEAPPQRTLKISQVRRLLASFDYYKPKGRRDLALCTLFLDTGLRVSEVCNLELRYLDLEERTLQVVVRVAGGRVRFFLPIQQPASRTGWRIGRSSPNQEREPCLCPLGEIPRVSG